MVIIIRVGAIEGSVQMALEEVKRLRAQMRQGYPKAHPNLPDMPNEIGNIEARLLGIKALAGQVRNNLVTAGERARKLAAYIEAEAEKEI